MGRTERFQRNLELERLLADLNALLAPAEAAANDRWDRPQYPVVLVIGPPRSGTTLMLQWLASLGVFAYPTNLLARFYAAPYVGGLINRLIGDPRFNYGDELVESISAADSFRSDLGKTRGMFEPSEFWYFWRRFIPNDQAELLTAEQSQSIDADGFVRGIAALQAAFDKPWAMKGIILQYNLSVLDAMFDQVVFIHTQRDLLANAASLLRARERYFGDPTRWFSVRPPGYERLLELAPEQQVVGQVELSNRSIAQQFMSIRNERQLAVDYEAFCKDPARVFAALRAKLAAQGFAMDAEYSGPATFTAEGRRESSEPHSPLATAVVNRTAWLPEIGDESAAAR